MNSKRICRGDRQFPLAQKKDFKRQEAVKIMPTKSNNTGGRGGRRPGGPEKTAVKEQYENGNPGGRDLTVLGHTGCRKARTANPALTFYLPNSMTAPTLEAGDIYRETWEWLDKLGVAKRRFHSS